jgi:hypothetical protein
MSCEIYYYLCQVLLSSLGLDSMDSIYITKKHNNVHLDFVKRFFYVLLSVTGYCYRAVSYKVSRRNCDHFQMYCAPHLEFYSFTINPPTFCTVVAADI